jgi:hypothetical protein
MILAAVQYLESNKSQATDCFPNGPNRHLGHMPSWIMKKLEGSWAGAALSNAIPAFLEAYPCS